MPSSWRAQAWSGDAGALLQPLQVLVAHNDAKQHGITSLDLVRVRFAAESGSGSGSGSGASEQPVVVVECIVDRHGNRETPRGSAELSEGNIQLHPWILHTWQELEGAVATVEPLADVAGDGRWRLELSVQDKYPPTATRSSNTVGQTASRTDLLPESVRQRKIDLERALQRQLRASGVLRAPCAAQLVAVRLLQETFVLRVETVRRQDAQEAALVVRVVGWSSDDDQAPLAEDAATEANALAKQVATLSVQEAMDSSYVAELSARLWKTGFVGYTGFMQDVLLNLALVLKRSKEDSSREQQIGSHGVLISGAYGVGKSLALTALQCELAREKIATWRVDGMSLLMEAESASSATAYEFLAHELQQQFPELGALDNVAWTTSLCVGAVLLDDVDVLFQSSSGQKVVDSGSDTQLPQLGSALLRLVDELSTRNARVVVVGTTASADANIPVSAKRAGRFSKVLDLVVPTEQARREILHRHLSGLALRTEGLSMTDTATSLASRLAALTGGYVAKDLVRICRNASVQAHAASSKDGDVEMEGSGSAVGWNELLLAQQQIRPSQLRELNVASPGASGSRRLAFAGYTEVQQQLLDLVSWKFHPTAAMNRLGISSASGILLSGPSGCGKTLLVQTLAAQAQVNFVSVKSSELLSKYFGDSEKTVRQLFARARAASPCILFFDEFDAIAHKRSFGQGDGGSSGGGVYARVLSTFLNEMDGVGSQRVTASSSDAASSSSSSAAAAAGGGILVMAATNRKDALDAALIRPGRIDKSVELGFPTTTDIQDILELYTRKMPLADDVDIQALASRSMGTRSFTGADVAAVCKEAAFRALREDLEAKSVCLQHLEAAWDQRAQDVPTYTAQPPSAAATSE